MSAVGIKELKNRLTHYLRRTKQGEDIVVTERGKPIAIIQRIGAIKPTGREVRLAQLAAQGVVILPSRKPSISIRPVRHTGPPLSHTILEEREHDRVS